MRKTGMGKRRTFSGKRSRSCTSAAIIAFMNAGKLLKGGLVAALVGKEGKRGW